MSQTEPAQTEPTLHVVTHRKWVATDFDLAGVTDVRHSLGLDLPDFEVGDSVWAPMEWMARAQAALSASIASGHPYGPFLDLSAPAANFLTRVPVSLLSREIRLVTAAEVLEMADEQNDRLSVTDDGPEAFAKPANCKIEGIPAKWYDLDGLALEVLAGGRVPMDQPFLITYDRLDLVEEHRLWVLDGQVVTSSPYLRHLDFIETDLRGHVSSTTWHQAMSTERAADAKAFGAHALATLAEPFATPFGPPLPRAFTLDVGITRGGPWVVIEANPAWSSALYGADPAVVADCVRASSRIVDMMPLSDPHRWQPDPYLRERVTQQRPLRAG